MTTPELYIPPQCLSLETQSYEQQIRLGLQGFPGTGKTWSSLTFPNPIVANLDRGLGAHSGRRDVIEIPLYDVDFCKRMMPSYKLYNQNEILIQWIEKEGTNLTKNQTLVVDNGTQIQKTYHAWYEKNKMSFLTKDGKIDGWAEWKQKIVLMDQLTTLFKSLSCHVVFMTHETEASVGKHAGKMRPAMTGGVADTIAGEFTDFFRQLSAAKPAADKIDDAFLARWKMSKAEFKAMCDTYPRDTIYFWRLDSTNDFDGKCSSLVNFPEFIPATYESFKKYRRKLPNVIP